MASTLTETSTGTRTLAAAIAAQARAAGIEKAFGMPGGEVLALIDELRIAGTEFVLCNHESSAGLMASAYGRLTGRPGLVLTTLGPGAANLLLPLANAQLERESLVAICGDLAASWPRSHTHQRLDLLGIFGPTTRYCAELTPQEGAGRFAAALQAAGGSPHGAALLTLSAEAATTSAGELHASPEQDESAPTDPERDAEELRRLLAAAERPLVVIGCGAKLDAAADLRRWTQRWELPVALTPKAKGMVGDEYERFVGVLDGAGLGSLMSETLAGADLIVGLGLDPVELIRTWHCTAPVAWVGDCGPRLDAVAGQIRLDASVTAVLAAIAMQPAPCTWADWTADAVARRRALLADQTLLTWIPRALREALPRDAIITTDVGSHKCLIAQFLATDQPGSFLTSNGLSAMGYGLPAAIGAKLARPDTAVLAVVGDGGFAMAAQELETAVRAQAPIVVVALVDTSLSLIQLLQQARGLPRCGVDYGRVDIPAIAAAHGAIGRSASTPAELRDAVAASLESHLPSVIAVPVGDGGYDTLL